MHRYERLEKNTQLGEGTYGIVYKARDTETNKYVALKVWKPIQIKFSTCDVCNFSY